MQTHGNQAQDKQGRDRDAVEVSPNGNTKSQSAVDIHRESIYPDTVVTCLLNDLVHMSATVYYQDSYGRLQQVEQQIEWSQIQDPDTWAVSTTALSNHLLRESMRNR